ncbi:MAG: hypothetical protein ACI8XM_002261, partial [Haloarculaceae archaeon]
RNPHRVARVRLAVAHTDGYNFVSIFDPARGSKLLMDL